MNHTYDIKERRWKTNRAEAKKKFLLKLWDQIPNKNSLPFWDRFSGSKRRPEERTARILYDLLRCETDPEIGALVIALAAKADMYATKYSFHHELKRFFERPDEVKKRIVDSIPSTLTTNMLITVIGTFGFHEARIWTNANEHIRRSAVDRECRIEDSDPPNEINRGQQHFCHSIYCCLRYDSDELSVTRALISACKFGGTYVCNEGISAFLKRQDQTRIKVIEKLASKKPADDDFISIVSRLAKINKEFANMVLARRSSKNVIRAVLPYCSDIEALTRIINNDNYNKLFREEILDALESIDRKAWRRVNGANLKRRHDAVEEFFFAKHPKLLAQVKSIQTAPPQVRSLLESEQTTIRIENGPRVPPWHVVPLGEMLELVFLASGDDDWTSKSKIRPFTWFDELPDVSEMENAHAKYALHQKLYKRAYDLECFVYCWHDREDKWSISSHQEIDLALPYLNCIEIRNPLGDRYGYNGHLVFWKKDQDHFACGLYAYSYNHDFTGGSDIIVP